MDSKIAKEEGVFGNPEVNVVKRENNQLRSEIESLKREKNKENVRSFERANLLKGVVGLLIGFGCLVYVLWLR